MANGNTKEHAKPWYAQLHDWLKTNPKKHAEILEIYNQHTLRQLSTGRQGIESIPLGKRMHLYDVTGLDCFRIEGAHPVRDFDLTKIRTGELPRDIILRRIEYDGARYKDVFQKLGVAYETFHKYVAGGELKPDFQKRIEQGLESIYGAPVSAREAPARAPEKAREREGAQKSATSHQSVQTDESDAYTDVLRSLNALKQNVAMLHTKIVQNLPSTLAAGVLEQQFQPAQFSLEQHIDAVNSSIRTLYHEVKYFEQAPNPERITLGKNMDLAKWKYISAILMRIDQPDDPVHAVVKMLESGTQGRKS